jgi:hypothetical protein
MYSSKMHRKQKNEIPRYGNYGKYGKYGNYGSCKRDVEESSNTRVGGLRGFGERKILQRLSRRIL